VPAGEVLSKDTLSFTIESRVLRELGERLVKQPDVALVELIKNAYDADAPSCTITYEPGRLLEVTDTGVGMTLDQFRDGWMRIGTSSKESVRLSAKYMRPITGEKGIGRFAVRFLGRHLHLETVAEDPKYGGRTRLVADFDWPKFDRHQDLGKVKVPYTLTRVVADTPTGTTLSISRLRTEVAELDLKKVRTGSIGILTPLRSLFRQITDGDDVEPDEEDQFDPGFVLDIEDDRSGEPEDVAAKILDGFVLRAQLRLKGRRVELKVFRRGVKKAILKIIETFAGELDSLYADIRFFPRREGAFRDMPVDGRRAYTWVQENAGVAVFDRNFRVRPYGTPGDDWLQLVADAVRNRRDPRSSLALKHFPMSTEVRASTSENWMLRLPQSHQLIGLVQVEGRRSEEIEEENEGEGLIASADREGFVENAAFKQLLDLMRGAVEAIAYADRMLQQEEEEKRRAAVLTSLRDRTQTAISEVRSNPNIAQADKVRIVAALAETQQMAERQDETARERERQLEIMSLLGVVAGFMTHEFGVALKELEDTHAELMALAAKQPTFAAAAKSFATHIKSLKEFVTYSSGYIQGAKTRPAKPYPVKPRLQRVRKYFGRYAEDRNIAVELTVEPDLLAPMVPPSLYDGIALNLYTNAIKAVTAKAGTERGRVAFRAWNDGRWHHLEVSDTGIGITGALRERVFDPLFTTTQSQNDPLGSGMGLGLALVRRGAEAFGGKAELVEPPPDYATCVRVRLPLETAK
jgi:signal transduction histidine kinase